MGVRHAGMQTMSLRRSIILIVLHTILMWVVAMGLIGKGLGLLGENPFAPTVGFAVVFTFIVVVSVGGWLAIYSVKQVYGSWQAMGWNTKQLWRQLAWGVVFGVVGAVITSCVIHLFFGTPFSDIGEAIVAVPIGDRFVFVLIGLHAGLVEESLFRGNLFGALQKRCPWLLAFIIQAAVFSLYHLSFGPASLINKCLLGMVFAMPQLIFKQRTLLSGAVSHFVVAVTMTSN
jgi:membrane protease YdiL (CAAX protease family)